MNLPNLNNIRIDKKKVVEYLLNASHPDGYGKAMFFQHCGFTITEWKVLRNALREHAQVSQVTDEVLSRHGIRYVVEGPIETPTGKQYTIRTIWIIEKERETPRLVTAIPLSK